jgi:hypothetical protein
MKKITITDVPDKVITLPHSDMVNIYAEKDKLSFDVFCDGVGCSFALTKKEIEEMLK